MDIDLKIGAVFSLASPSRESVSQPVREGHSAADDEDDDRRSLDTEENLSFESTDTAVSPEEQSPESPASLQMEIETNYNYTLESITPPLPTPESNKGNRPSALFLSTIFLRHTRCELHKFI